MNDPFCPPDLFISYNWQDHAVVEALARALEGRGLQVFLDRWSLVPGRAWQPELEDQIGACRAVTVILGSYGMGPWQQREASLALQRQTHEDTFAVIPVLLHGADPPLGFLSQNTWVDLRNGLDDSQALDSLTAAVRSEPPGEVLKARARAVQASICPYRGLNAFREEDAPFFFGRDKFIDRLVEVVAHQPMVAVVGPSGSGKSSVVRAGLVADLRRSPEGMIWEIATLLPGDRPCRALAKALLPLYDPKLLLGPTITQRQRDEEVAALANAIDNGSLLLRDVVTTVLEQQPGTDRLLLVVDQWEELYTQCRQAQAIRQFVDQLIEATIHAPLTVVLTLRTDFLGYAQEYRPLLDRLQDGTVQLGPMTQEELEQVITRPAEKVGLNFEPGLVRGLLEDVGEEPGNLPLLEFALTRLWETRRGGCLHHAAYEAMGKVQGAIATRAEAVYAKLQNREQEAVRRVFLALVQLGKETGDTRRRANLAEFGEAERAIVQRLADARLLVTGRDETTGEETVEVAHEALIRRWERLKGWVNERREDLYLRDQVKAAAREWCEHRQDRAFLWSDERVIEAGRALKRLGADVKLTQAEQEFLGPVNPDAMLAELEDLNAPHERRATIGVRLSILGDQRPGVGLHDGLPNIAWCEVSGGEVDLELLWHRERSHLRRWMKTLRAKKHFVVAPFAVVKYLVTYAQYRAFLEAEDGYHNEQWWEGLYHRPEPGRQFMRRDNYPVDTVSWFDAIAFCRWLSAQLGYKVRLPTEWEWQQAATGSNPANAYPWGLEWDNRRANTYESGLSRATAVGMYPGGTSAQGVLDMAGNIWEWCLNKYDQPKDIALGGDDPRVVRGGSWVVLPYFARTAFRYYYSSPGLRGSHLGFRICRSSPT